PPQFRETPASKHPSSSPAHLTPQVVATVRPQPADGVVGGGGAAVEADLDVGEGGWFELAEFAQCGFLGVGGGGVLVAAHIDLLYESIGEQLISVFTSATFWDWLSNVRVRPGDLLIMNNSFPAPRRHC